MAGSKWLVLARAYLDSGAENLAGANVVHPDRVYEGRALRWGSIERSIPTPSGLPHVGDALVRLADTDRHWRGLLATQTARRRKVELKLVAEGASEGEAPSLYTGEIV